MSFQLAQVNTARLVAPIDSPPLAEFVGALDSVNAVADLRTHGVSPFAFTLREHFPPPHTMENEDVAPGSADWFCPA